MAIKSCIHCGERFQLRPQTPHQTYCTAAACQRARKRQWHLEKLRSDPDYRANQRAAQRAWSARNGGYWRDRRQARPKAGAQRDVPKRRADSASRPKPRARVLPRKMDVSNLLPGLYLITPRPEFPHESVDSWVVEIAPVHAAARARWTCQERT